MEKNESLGGVLTGLLLGAVVGAGIFAMKGSLNLRLGFVSMMVAAVVGAVIGYQVLKIRERSRTGNRPPMTNQSPDEMSRGDLRMDGYDPQVPVSSQIYKVDALRLAILMVWMSLLGTGSFYLEWKSGGVGFSIFFVFAALFFGVALYHLATWFLNSGIQVTINSDGFLYYSGRDRWFIEWEAVDKVWERHQKTVWNGIPVRNIHTLTIVTRDGKRVRLSRTLGRIGFLAEGLQGAVTSYLLPRTIETLETGGSVDFVAFTITSQGIQRKQDFLPWHEVDKIIIYPGRIQVRRTGKNWLNWSEAKTWNVANFPLFKIVASQYAKVEG